MKLEEQELEQYRIIVERMFDLREAIEASGKIAAVNCLISISLLMVLCVTLSDSVAVGLQRMLDKNADRLASEDEHHRNMFMGTIDSIKRLHDMGDFFRTNFASMPRSCAGADGSRAKERYDLGLAHCIELINERADSIAANLDQRNGDSDE